MSDNEQQIMRELIKMKILINSAYGISSQSYHNFINSFNQLKIDLKNEKLRELRKKKLNRICGKDITKKY